MHSLPPVVFQYLATEYIKRLKEKEATASKNPPQGGQGNGAGGSPVRDQVCFYIHLCVRAYVINVYIYMCVCLNYLYGVLSFLLYIPLTLSL